MKVWSESRELGLTLTKLKGEQIQSRTFFLSGGRSLAKWASIRPTNTWKSIDFFPFLPKQRSWALYLFITCFVSLFGCRTTFSDCGVSSQHARLHPREQNQCEKVLAWTCNATFTDTNYYVTLSLSHFCSETSVFVKNLFSLSVYFVSNISHPILVSVHPLLVF